MANIPRPARAWRGSPWRKAMWGAAAALLLLPAVAMRFTDEVAWDGADFLVMGLMLAAACGAVDAGMRRSGSLAYRAGVAVAVAGGFGLLWVNLAVGLIGSEDNPVNRLYLGVLATAGIGAALARLRPRGLAFAMLATAAAQGLVAVIAVASGRAGPAEAWVEVAGVTAFFMGPWLLAAALFRRAQADAPPREPSGGARTLREPTREKAGLHRRLAAAVFAFGVALMAMMIATEGEPGLIPLVLVVGGGGALAVTWMRARASRD